MWAPKSTVGHRRITRNSRALVQPGEVFLTVVQRPAECREPRQLHHRIKSLASDSAPHAADIRVLSGSLLGAISRSSTRGTEGGNNGASIRNHQRCLWLAILEVLLQSRSYLAHRLHKLCRTDVQVRPRK